MLLADIEVQGNRKNRTEAPRPDATGFTSLFEKPDQSRLQ